MSPDTISAAPGASSGDAVAMPPAVSSGSGSRDHAMRTPCALPSPSAATRRSAPCETLIAMSRKPARASASTCHTISALPPASSSGFGVTSDSGRMRSPRPAARIIARAVAPDSGGACDIGQRLVERVEQRRERVELAIARARTAQVAHHQRHVVDVGRLAVAMLEPREDAEDLELPLYAHPLEIAPERREVGGDRQM